ASPATSRNGAGLARSDTLEPAAPDCRGYAEQNEEEREHPAHAGDAPIAGCCEQFLDKRHVGASFGRRDSERARQRQPEHAEPVCHADAKVDAECGGRNEPAIEAGLGYDSVALKKPRSRTNQTVSPSYCRHRVSPLSRPRFGVFVIAVFLILLPSISRSPCGHLGPTPYRPLRD